MCIRDRNAAISGRRFAGHVVSLSPHPQLPRGVDRGATPELIGGAGPQATATLRRSSSTRRPPSPTGQRHPQRYGCERASAPGIASRPTGGYEQCLLAFDGCACGAHRQRRADSSAKPLDSVLVVLRPSVVGDCGGKSPRHPYVVSGARCMGRRTPPRVCAAPSDDGQSLSKASLTFSPACLMLLTL